MIGSGSNSPFDIQQWESEDKYTDTPEAKMFSLVARILSRGHIPMAVIDISLRRIILWKDGTAQPMSMPVTMQAIGTTPLMSAFKPAGDAVKMEEA